MAEAFQLVITHSVSNWNIALKGTRKILRERFAKPVMDFSHKNIHFTGEVSFPL